MLLFAADWKQTYICVMLAGKQMYACFYIFIFLAFPEFSSFYIPYIQNFLLSRHGHFTIFSNSRQFCAFFRQNGCCTNEKARYQRI
jgi:hypothetical protein